MRHDGRVAGEEVDEGAVRRPHAQPHCRAHAHAQGQQAAQQRASRDAVLRGAAIYAEAGGSIGHVGWIACEVRCGAAIGAVRRDGGARWARMCIAVLTGQGASM